MRMIYKRFLSMIEVDCVFLFARTTNDTADDPDDEELSQVSGSNLVFIVII